MAKIRDLLDQSDEAEIKEQLQFLLNAAKGKLDEQKELLEKVFLNPSFEEKIRVIPDTEIKWYDEYRYNVKQGASDAIDQVIDRFFTGEKGQVEGFKSLVKAGLSKILDNESAGECQENIYFVGMEHNAIIRVDVSSWRYNYTSNGHVKDVFCCTFCKSLVDHTKVRLDTLVYLISEQAEDEFDKLKDYITKLKEIWALLEPQSATEVANRVQPMLR
jgi:uncharacterized protein YlzI (FlbEa/FlbD family)